MRNSERRTDVCSTDNRHHVIEVILGSGEGTLSNDGDALLDGGANLALVGDEVHQFGSAEQIDATRWRLSRLWRGRRGTEAAIGTQAAGDRFVLLTPGKIGRAACRERVCQYV